MKICEACEGSRLVYIRDGEDSYHETCPECKGKGEVANDVVFCPECKHVSYVTKRNNSTYQCKRCKHVWLRLK